ncbi:MULTISPECIES: hypothetical protein [unclassified Halomonas]|uniref:hypothetical protein n=1 Tax=unclassified Halomonas TaxID=2609666 RepID=UPI002097DF99|nr:MULTISPECIES: hypothetical protein [unclassified Halomonas]MCO7213754.1 hypothetical protein [Halomonas sp. OfavH-34-E]
MSDSAPTSSETPPTANRRLSPSRRLKVLLTLAIVAVMALSWLDVLDRATQRQVEGATTQALLAFAAARGLNAGISVLQSTEMGVGVSTHPFEALDPFNDLVEDYASVMKLAIGSLIGQTLLLEITGSLMFKIALSLAGALLILCLWRDWRLTPLAWKAFALIGLGRFLLLLTLVASTLVDQAFLDERTSASMAEVQGLSEEVQATGLAEAGDALTPQQRERLEAEMADTDQRRQQLRESLIETNRQIGKAEDAVEQSRGRLSLLTARLSLTERLNPFHDNPEIERLEQQLGQRRQRLAGLTDEREGQLAELAAVDRERDTLRRRLAGEDPDEGLFDGLAERIGALTDGLSISAIQSRIESGTNAILQLMALFVMRTLVIPLLFLWLGLKLFKGLYSRPGASLRLPPPAPERVIHPPPQADVESRD